MKIKVTDEKSLAGDCYLADFTVLPHLEVSGRILRIILEKAASARLTGAPRPVQMYGADMSSGLRPDSQFSDHDHRKGRHSEFSEDDQSVRTIIVSKGSSHNFTLSPQSSAKNHGSVKSAGLVSAEFLKLSDGVQFCWWIEKCREAGGRSVAIKLDSDVGGEPGGQTGGLIKSCTHF